MLSTIFVCFFFSLIFMGLACLASTSDEVVFSGAVCNVLFWVSGLLFGWGTWLTVKVLGV